jgi:hypothetical protein
LVIFPSFSDATKRGNRRQCCTRGQKPCDDDDQQIAVLALHISRIERLRDLPARWNTAYFQDRAVAGFARPLEQGDADD